MKVEFFRPADPSVVAGTATWDGSRVSVHADDPAVAGALERVFRPASVVLDDPSLRTAGTRGEVVVEPGDLTWFRAAATVRGGREGLGLRFVTDRPGGWDPAGAYRPMGAWLARHEAGE
ncbi:MAG TPA: hypothetical protein VGB28_02265 [Actinomycetota bacterium]|jgi:hypothetical protein